jgi:DNA cross-link repair 1A protein
VPYSEHSSFFELSCFALSMPGPDLKMIATVNVGNEKRYVHVSWDMGERYRQI